MKPRLATIAGKLKGIVFSIGDEPFLIGRESKASLCVASGSVSRRHALIEKDGEGFAIKDLASLNGTFLNDVPVRRRRLAHGDRVRIGDSQFVFLLHDEDTPSALNRVEFDNSGIAAQTTSQFSFNDAVYLMARDFSALMKISTTINYIRDLDELNRTLLELLFEVIPAESGAILLNATAGRRNVEEFASVFGLHRSGSVDSAVKVSRTITSQVISSNAAVLISDWAENKDLAITSLGDRHPVSILCVPLILLDQTLGVIYLDTNKPGVHFDKDHLQFLSAIAAIAAVAIENVRHIEWLKSENQRLLTEIHIEHDMVGESSAMQQIHQMISKAAPTDATVLISGESGTGKELVARALHRHSKRADKPFIAVNCAALTESLLESEVFGHEKGAFTGAIALKKGRLEIADGGTVFLDEIGELSPQLQVKLLRVLQEREFERVGGTKAVKLDIRLIAATNRDLETAIAQGLFRRDLYYRLNVVELEVPPLRSRQEDIPLLANYFAMKYAEKCNRKVFGVAPEAHQILLNYEWPGNVRELENAIERAIVLGTAEHVLPEDLPEAVLERQQPTSAPTSRYHEAVAETKKQLILNAIGEARGNYTEAAKILGVHPNYLHRLIRNFDLREQCKKFES
ncbi:MAG TPA: sigma 54-interacting transcriptional regulator [Pyrinomonadaceae bacterium]|nr:sigma 54-interacting transcriptional regulator [Pyrinomonadaceae bacterium]